MQFPLLTAPQSWQGPMHFHYRDSNFTMAIVKVHWTLPRFAILEYRYYRSALLVNPASLKFCLSPHLATIEVGQKCGLASSYSSPRCPVVMMSNYILCIHKEIQCTKVPFLVVAH